MQPIRKPVGLRTSSILGDCLFSSYPWLALLSRHDGGTPARSDTRAKFPKYLVLREGRLSPSAVPEERGALRLDRRPKTRPNFRRMCVPHSYLMATNVLSRTAVGGVPISLPDSFRRTLNDPRRKSRGVETP